MYQLKPAEVKKVLNVFNGSKKVKGVKGARKISEITILPHRSIMKTLEEKGLKTYSPGSYN